MVAEEGEQSKSDNYPSSDKSKNLGELRLEVNYGSQWTSGRLPHPPIGETDSISELCKPLGQNSQNMHYSGSLG